jgi:hypothetical protein
MKSSRRLAKAESATVYKATDTRLGRTVAIKTLAAGHGQRSLQEARAIAALSHPHICVLHDVGPDYLVIGVPRGSASAWSSTPRPGAAHGCHSPVRAAVPPIGRVAGVLNAMNLA